jgi:hypothetical protein
MGEEEGGRGDGRGGEEGRRRDIEGEWLRGRFNDDIMNI